MRFKIRNKKGFSKISISYVWIKKTNLYLFISYTTKGGGVIGYTSSIARVDDCLEVWILGGHGSKTNTLCVRPIAETKAEKKLLDDCWTHLMSTDYCDTQLVLMPALKSSGWAKAKRVFIN